MATLPSWMHAVADLLPPSYVFEGMRTIIAGGTLPLTGLFVGGSLAFLYVLLAALFFARIYRQAVRTGLIARYSAESVS